MGVRRKPGICSRSRFPHLLIEWLHFASPINLKSQTSKLTPGRRTRLSTWITIALTSSCKEPTREVEENIVGEDEEGVPGNNPPVLIPLENRHVSLLSGKN
jgi:hypothetical protein